MFEGMHARPCAFLSLLPVLREKVRMRVISSTRGTRRSKSPSPLPSSGVPGEGGQDFDSN
jgi:hypothetical protein